MKLAVLLAVFSAVLGAPGADKITNLPLVNFTVNFQQYSGYLTASKTRFFHYWFTYSQHDYTTDPVILWLNGGPGCSSLEGLLEELGPFKISDNANVVYANAYSWNKFASVLFVESPAGVGFSYATDGDVATDDDEVAAQNYAALTDFFRKFPEFRDRDFYITGESYAGVYLPMLGAKIAADKDNFPHFKGMAIGNGALNWPNNYATMVPLYYYHAIVRQELWDRVSSQCCDNNILSCDIFGLFKTNPTCKKIVIELLDGTDNLNSYNLYDTCYLDGSHRKEAQMMRRWRRILGITSPSRRENLGQLPLCAQTNNTQNYLARRDVRTALHIPGLLPDWAECSEPVEYEYSTTHMDMTPEFMAVSQSGARVLVYNGDVDTVCNHVMNRNFLTNLNVTLQGDEKVNQPWYYAGETPNVAGFVEQLAGGIDFVTIRGSGHFVPQDKPRESFQMLYNWIHGLDYSTPVPAL